MASEFPVIICRTQEESRNKIRGEPGRSLCDESGRDGDSLDQVALVG